MSEDFLRRQEIDLMCLQEVTHANVNTINQYTAHMNTGTDGRGTAVLSKDGFIPTNIQRMPSGRGIAATLNGIRIVNIYVPSGSEKRREREAFYNEEFATLLPPKVTEMILAADFNCMFSQADCTGRGNHSKALERLVRGLGLRDAWKAGPQKTVFTHYTTKGTSRIDRIYATEILRRALQGAEAVVAAFTDHLAIDIPGVARGKG
jgi:exonuclease III